MVRTLFMTLDYQVNRRLSLQAIAPIRMVEAPKDFHPGDRRLRSFKGLSDIIALATVKLNLPKSSRSPQSSFIGGFACRRETPSRTTSSRASCLAIRSFRRDTGLSIRSADSGTSSRSRDSRCRRTRWDELPAAGTNTATAMRTRYRLESASRRPSLRRAYSRRLSTCLRSERDCTAF